MAEWWETFFDQPYYEMFFRPRTGPKRTIAEAKAAARLLRLRKGQSVLDLGCGWGRHCYALHDLGYQVSGIDCSARMIDLATNERQSHPPDFRQADYRSLPFDAETIHAAVSMYTSFGFYDHREDDLAYLCEVHRVLRQGGRILMDLKDRSSVPLEDKEWRFSADGEHLLLEEKKMHPLTGRVERRWQVMRSGECVFDWTFGWRVYSPQELAVMFQESGLAVDALYGDWDRAPYSHDSPRTIIVGRKC